MTGAYTTPPLEMATRITHALDARISMRRQIRAHLAKDAKMKRKMRLARLEHTGRGLCNAMVYGIGFFTAIVAVADLAPDDSSIREQIVPLLQNLWNVSLIFGVGVALGLTPREPSPLDKAVDEAMDLEWNLTEKNAPDPVTEGESVGEETSNAL